MRKHYTVWCEVDEYVFPINIHARSLVLISHEQILADGVEKTLLDQAVVVDGVKIELPNIKEISLITADKTETIYKEKTENENTLE